jgi:hypothetical protein
MSGSPTMDRPAQLVFVYDRTSELGHYSQDQCKLCYLYSHDRIQSGSDVKVHWVGVAAFSLLWES